MTKTIVNEAKIEIMTLFEDEIEGKPRIFTEESIPRLLSIDETIINEALKELTKERKLYRYSDGCYSTQRDSLYSDEYDSRIAFVAPTKLRLSER